METKKQIRSKVYAKRKEACRKQVLDDSRTITGIICETNIYQNADNILIYVDYHNEVITRFLIEDAWSRGKSVYVPKVKHKEMDFYKISSYEELYPGVMGIPEPDGTSEKADFGNALMIMPGVAFDRRKHRIGYGGGYYDRYLERYAGLDTIAVAFEFQLFDEIPYESFDRCPNLLVTEKGCY